MKNIFRRGKKNGIPLLKHEKKVCHTDFKSPNCKIYLTYICLSESILQTNCQNQTSETETYRMRLTNLSSASFRSPEVSHFAYAPLIMLHDVFCTLDFPNILTGRTIQLRKSLGNLKKKKKKVTNTRNPLSRSWTGVFHQKWKLKYGLFIFWTR